MRFTTTIWLAAFSLTLWAQGPNNSGVYYQAANGKRGAALKSAFCSIIYNRTERSYGDLWTDFQTTDVRDDGKVWDMYSDITNYTFVTDQDRGSGGNKEGQYYNREHSFPNSWFGGKVQPMYTDLHHMYPTDKYVNNKRGNNPLGETKGETFTSANGFSKLGKCTYPGYDGIVFEPNDEYKGDFARTYFYMVTCYEEKLPDWYANYGEVKPTLDGSIYPGFSDWQLEMLMKWAEKDPVSQKEIKRNNAVYDIQNNRNPFIDYPGLEQYIWGNMKDVDFQYDTSDICQIEASQEEHAGWHTLDGRRLPGRPTVKGVYIHQRHKVVIK
ncbi:MAG: endonuclease [Prevotella sp.]|nr:endonuclease [Prevotella sp.]